MTTSGKEAYQAGVTSRLAEHLFTVPVLNTAQVMAALDVTRPTAQSAVDALVERGDLVEVTGRERGRIYEAPSIFDAVYGAVEVPGDDEDGGQLSFDVRDLGCEQA